MNSSTRTVIQIVNAMPANDGAGVKLQRIIGQPLLKNLDPFLLLDEFGSENPNDYLAGFPPHPHRGFQTVTYMLEGRMLHQDSVGNKGVIEKGGIQWMNAGKGIIHEEMPQHSDKPMRGFQLWVNLPAAEKMSNPSYQDIQAKLVPVIDMDIAKIKILAGEFSGKSGPVTTQAATPLFLDIIFESEGQLQIPIETEHSTFIYCYEGELKIADKRISKGQLAVLSTGAAIHINGTKDGKCILVAGAPINEPIAQYGPFVMNTQAEIQQAIADYQAGKLTE